MFSTVTSVEYHINIGHFIHLPARSYNENGDINSYKSGYRIAVAILRKFSRLFVTECVLVPCDCKGWHTVVISDFVLAKTLIWLLRSSVSMSQILESMLILKQVLELVHHLSKYL